MVETSPPQQPSGVLPLVRRLVEGCCQSTEHRGNYGPSEWTGVGGSGGAKRGGTASTGQRQGAGWRRAFNILLKYDEVGFPYVHEDKRADANARQLMEAAIELAEKGRGSSASRLQELWEELQTRTEALLLPRGPGSESSALLNGSSAPFMEHEALLSLLLELRGSSRASREGQEYGGQSLHRAAAWAQGDHGVLGLSWGLEGLQALNEGSVGRRWAATEPPEPPPRGGGRATSRNCYEVEEPPSQSFISSAPLSPSALGRSSTGFGDISIHTVLDDSFATLGDADFVQQRPCSSDDGLTQSFEVGWMPQRMDPLREALWRQQTPAQVPYYVEIDPQAHSLPPGEAMSAWPGDLAVLLPPQDVPYSLLLSESDAPSPRSSIMGSVPPSPTARSLRSSKLAGGGRGGKRVENSQVYIRREEGQTKLRVTSISEEAAVRLALLAMQGVEAALQQLSSGLLATPTLGAAALGTLLHPAVETGRRCINLRAFANLHGSGATPDPSLMAFANAVDLFLSLHTASLQSIQEAASERRKAEGVGGLSRGHKLPVTLLELMVHCERARAHLHSLSVICGCEEGQEPKDTAAAYPTGAPLLTHLYKALREAEDGPSASLLRWLFSAASKPFMDQARAWAFTACEVGAAWHCPNGPHLDSLGHFGRCAAEAVGIAGALPCRVPSFLLGLEREFLMSGLQLRFLAALPGGSTLAHRMRAIADAEAVEAAAVVSQGGGEGAPDTLWWAARSGSVPLIFGADALRALCAVHENAARERAAEAAEMLDALVEQRRLIEEATEMDLLRRAERRASERAAARAEKSQAAAERRRQRAALLREQKEAIGEREAAERAAREANIREEQELIERAVRTEHAALLAEVAAQEASSAAEMREADKRGKRLDWRSARWRLSAARRSALLAIQQEEEVAAAQARKTGRGRSLPLPKTRPTLRQLEPNHSVAEGRGEEQGGPEKGDRDQERAGKWDQRSFQEGGYTGAGSGRGSQAGEEREEGAVPQEDEAGSKEDEVVGIEDAALLGTEGNEAAGTAWEADGEQQEAAGSPSAKQTLPRGQRAGWGEPIRPFPAAGSPSDSPRQTPSAAAEGGEGVPSVVGGVEALGAEEEGAAAWNPWVPAEYPRKARRRRWDVSGGNAEAEEGGKEAGQRLSKGSWNLSEAEDMMPVEAALEATVARSILAQYRCMSGTALTILREEYRFSSYCKSLARFFFLEHGDFANQLIQELTAIAEAGIALSNLEAQSILEATLRESSAGADLLGGRVTLAVCPGRRLGKRSLPTEKPDRGEGAALLLRSDRVDGMDGVVLGHEPQWPLSAVVSPASLDAYGDIATMLLRFRTCTACLLHLWRTLRSVRGAVLREQRYETRERIRQLLLFRHEAEHFTCAMQGYMYMQLQGAVWASFEGRLAAAGDLQDMAEAHDAYLAAAAKSCLLTAGAGNYRAAVENALQKLLDVRTLLHIREGHAEGLLGRVSSEEVWGECRQLIADFRRSTAFLFKILKVQADKRRPVGELFHSFNLSSYYSET